METQLQDIIEKIKREGIEGAQQKADQITDEARKEAQSIVKEAEAQAADIRSKAEKDAAREKAASEAAIQQAGRDLVLSLENQIRSMFGKIISSEVSQQMSGDALGKAVASVVESWNSDKGLDVLLPESELTKVEAYLKGKLSKALLKGTEFKASPRVQTGFRISEKGGNAYYDFSAAAVAENLSAFLNDRISDLLRQSNE